MRLTPVMLGWLAKANIGLSTMVDEHFGINVVEFMVCIPFSAMQSGMNMCFRLRV